MAKELELNGARSARLEEIKGKFLARCPERLKMREDTVKEANDLMSSPEIDITPLDALI